MAERVEARLAICTRDTNGCLIAPTVSASGYAMQTKDDDRRPIAMHRAVYTVKVGPIPAGITVHHKCAVRACLEESHLQLATHAENIGEMNARKSYERRIAALESEVNSLRAQLAKSNNRRTP